MSGIRAVGVSIGVQIVDGRWGSEVGVQQINVGRIRLAVVIEITWRRGGRIDQQRPVDQHPVC